MTDAGDDGRSRGPPTGATSDAPASARETGNGPDGPGPDGRDTDGCRERSHTGARTGGNEGADAGPRARTGGSGRADAREVRLSVPSMDCASCAEKVTRGARAVEGVTDVDPRVAAGEAVVRFDPPATVEAIVDRVERAGYPVEGVRGDGVDADDGAEDGADGLDRRAVETAVASVALVAGLVLSIAAPDVVATVLGSGLRLADLAFLAAVAVGGRGILVDGVRSVRARTVDIDLLMSIAIVGALAASLAFGERLYFEAATLAALFGVAQYLERRSMDRARRSLRALMDLSPDEATVRRDGREVRVPADDVAVGEVVLVRPGERIPRDGEVIEGSSAVDQSPVTGESVPVDKAVGDAVYAGTIVEGGYLEVRVTAAAGEDTIARVVDLVADARAGRTDRERFVERFAAWYTPVVVGFAALVTVGSPAVLGVSWATAVVYGLTLLVLACPCAFVISTPVSVVSGITSAARNGVLIKGGEHLEAMGDVDVVALDKTGTLTRGELTVTDVIPLNGNTRDEVLRCARGLERRSEHPIGEAIVAAAGRSGSGSGPVDDAGEVEVDDFESIAGRGVRADLDGTPHLAGSPGLFADLGFDLSHVHATTEGGTVTRTARDLCDRHGCLDLLSETVPALQREGKTVVLVGTDEELEGVVAVADEVRPEARAAVARLRELGVERTVMLTGDNERTARAVADAVGVDEVRAELLPDEKVAAVRALREAHDGVAMVGDGVNDAPALATATVGVAMGAAGTDAALETADVALMADDLRRLPYCYDLARRANGVIRQNVAASLAVKAGLALAVPFGAVPVWLAVLAGDAGMTTAVTANAMRLGRVRPADPDDGPPVEGSRPGSGSGSGSEAGTGDEGAAGAGDAAAEPARA